MQGSCSWGCPPASSRIAGGGTYRTPYHQANSDFYPVNYGSEYADRPNTQLREMQRENENGFIFNVIGFGVVLYVAFLSAEIFAKALSSDEGNNSNNTKKGQESHEMEQQQYQHQQQGEPKRSGTEVFTREKF
jgi:hypothetical protein